MVNIELLRDVVAWADYENSKPVEESQWYQGEFVQNAEAIGRTCGTAYCIAGRVAALSGRLVDEHVMVDGELVLIEDYAAAELGIAEWRGTDGGDHLFDASNTIEDIHMIAKQLAYADGEEL